MPVWVPALRGWAAGPDLNSVLHFQLAATLDADFFLRLGPLADIIPIPSRRPERRLDRRPVPHRRPRLLPVRDAPAHARRDAAAIDEAQDRPLLGVWHGAASARARRPRPAGRERAGSLRGHRPHALAGGVGRARAAAHDRARAASASPRPPWHRPPARPRRREPPGAAHRGATNAVRSASDAPPRAPRRGPPPPVRPSRAQRLVLGALDRPGHQPVRRPGQPDRARRVRLRGHEVARSRSP